MTMTKAITSQDAQHSTRNALLAWHPGKSCVLLWREPDNGLLVADLTDSTDCATFSDQPGLVVPSCTSPGSPQQVRYWLGDRGWLEHLTILFIQSDNRHFIRDRLMIWHILPPTQKRTRSRPRWWQFSLPCIQFTLNQDGRRRLWLRVPLNIKQQKMFFFPVVQSSRIGCQRSWIHNIQPCSSGQLGMTDQGIKPFIHSLSCSLNFWKKQVLCLMQPIFILSSFVCSPWRSPSLTGKMFLPKNGKITHLILRKRRKRGLLFVQ
jgi:hypothetical protein